MTNEEELDRLKQRTDALTQSVELLVSLHRDLEIKADARSAKLERNVDRLVGIVENIANMVSNHEGRIRKLEGE
jgi:class 3 adenylate cyclase